MNKHIRNIEEYDLRNFTHEKLKHELMLKFGEIDEKKSLINFIAFVSQHILGWLIIIYFNNIIVSLATSIYMGFNLVGLFIVFHDAGHRTRSKNIKLNDFQGDIAAGLVGCGISWVLARESHRKHHLDTGKIKDPTALWLPMTVAEYSNANRISQLLYKLKMTNIFFSALEFGSFAKRNIANSLLDIFPKPKKRREFIRTVITGLSISLLEILLAYKIMGFYGLFFIYILPKFLFLSFGPILDRLNHANPEMLFYDNDNWHTDESNMQGTIRVEYHPIINYLINDMNEHSIHHYVPSIPGYNLRKARLYVEEKYPLLFNKQKFSWSYLGQIYSQCHLLESENNPTFISFQESQQILIEKDKLAIT